jgi:hypothetical protein
MAECSASCTASTRADIVAFLQRRGER